MNKKWILAALGVAFCASVAFAQTGSVTYGEVDVVGNAEGAVVVGEEVTYPTQAAKAAKQSADAKKAAAKKVVAEQKSAAKAYQEKVGAVATQKANDASLKKGEPTLKTNVTTTTTDVYDVRVKDKKGTTDYGIVEERVTNAKGTTTTGGVIYTNYTPSKVARANEKAMELSFAAGGTYLSNKDSFDDRYGKRGFAAGVSLLKEKSPHFAWGLDYMMLHPKGRKHDTDGVYRHYKSIYGHNIALAGKLTLNAWDNLQFYLPMGVGMMNARMKTHATMDGNSKNKWGASGYIGLGMQYDLTASLFMGLEYRYTYAWINDKNLSGFDRDKNLQFHTAFFRVGMRF